jgi:formylglycine-generating enzyme required for sulfatase activity
MILRNSTKPLVSKPAMRDENAMKTLVAWQKNRKFLWLLCFLILSAFSPFNIRPAAQAQGDPPVSSEEILSYLKLPNVNSTLLRRNEQLVEQVKKRGLDFSLSAEIEKEMRKAGASEALIKAVRQKSLPVTPATASLKQITNSIGMEFVMVPAGSFMMGSDKGNVDERPIHKVTLDYDFYIGKYEITIGQWKKVMGEMPDELKKANPKFRESDNQPVIYVTWNDAKEFIARLNARNDGFEYRLPSEAEWEYACRAGTKTEFAFGNSLGLGRANYNDDYPYPNEVKGKNLERTVEVGSYEPNAWGLYNMHGNVWEWVEDVYADNYNSPELPVDGSPNLAVGDTKVRVLRGGSWLDVGSSSLRSAIRLNLSSASRYGGGAGFRLIARVK